MKLYFLILILLFGIMACESAKDPSEVEKTSAISENNHERMIREVNRAHAAVDPTKISYYLNESRAQKYYQEASASPKNDLTKMNLLIRAHQEFLKAGQTERAIKGFEEILQGLSKQNFPDKKKVLYQLLQQLAIAQLRLGEQKNCQQNHTAESCMIPIKGKGIHLLPDGSKKATSLYEVLLRQNPNDFQSKWLLNIAYMTLGQYPDGVPEAYLIDPDYFKSDINVGQFTDVSMQAGTDVLGLSGGCALDDFDGDGYIDVMASSWGFTDQLRYLRNQGDGTFKDVHMEAGLKGITGGLNIRHADYNNDGYLDVLVLRGAWLGDEGRIPNSLLKNNGDGTFTDVTIEAGLLHRAPTQTAEFTDFNLDGWLDLVVGNESVNGSEFPCQIYLGNEDGAFTDKSSELGFQVTAFIKGVSVGDVNNDGYPDIHLSNYNGENYFFLNKLSENTGFVNVTKSAGLGSPKNSFPSWFFDFDNDGDEDLFVSGYSNTTITPSEFLAKYIDGQKVGERPRLFINDGQGQFKDKAIALGLDEPISTMGCNYGDLDNDGFEDFYLATGDPNFNSIVPNKMYHNGSGRRVNDVTTSGGFGNIQKGHGVGFADLDNDGDQDIYAVMGGAYEGDTYQNLLFKNPGNKNPWIQLKLIGVQSNRSAIGARIKIMGKNRNGQTNILYKTVSSGASFGSNSLQLEVGLGKMVAVNSVEVTWPNSSQTKELFKDLQPNHYYELKEGSGSPKMIIRKQFELGLGATTPHKHHHHNH